MESAIGRPEILATGRRVKLEALGLRAGLMLNLAVRRVTNRERALRLLRRVARRISAAAPVRRRGVWERESGAGTAD